MATSPTTPTGGVAGNSGAYQPKFRLTPEKYSSLNDLLEAKGSTEADAINKPEVRDLLIKTYGDQGITGFLKLTGAINNAGTADQIEFFEEGRRHRVLVLSATSVTSTPDTFDFVIADDNDTDPATSKFCQTRDVIMNADTGVRYIVVDDLRNDPADSTNANNAKS